MKKRESQDRILTTPEHEDYQAYLPTGNLHVSLPLVNPEEGSIDRINVLHMGSRGLLEFAGVPGEPPRPFMRPWLRVAGQSVELAGQLSWDRLQNWVPQFEYRPESAASQKLAMKGTIVVPVGHRGFVYLFELANLTSSERFEVAVGLNGQWGRSLQTIYTSRELNAEHHVYPNAWIEGPVFEIRPGTALGSLAVTASEPLDRCGWSVCGKGAGPAQQDSVCACPPQAVHWTLGKRLLLEPGESRHVAFYWAAHQEGDGARTTAVDLARRGWETLLEETLSWLEQRSYRVPADVDGHRRLTELLNLNNFFNYFFAQGWTVDTEELALVTSRSPRYYVSAAFWARDALLWSFPALLLVDAEHARKVLLTAFTRYIRNVGLHSLYIDGSLLYPGFELDELVAYLIALERYVEATHDESVLFDPAIRDGVDRILEVLHTKRHHSAALYETFLLPSDDPATQPYVTYNNVLTWRALRYASVLYGRWGDDTTSDWAAQEARAVEEAVWEHCTVEGPLGRMFAWCVDPTSGEYELYDEPPGSLRMLPYYGFCTEADPAYQNTVNWIFSEHNPHYYPEARFNEVGCPHTDEPFVMGLFNSLLNGRVAEALEILREAELDGGVACEGFDRSTGLARTGMAFATCSGFLAYALWRALVDANE